MTQPLDRRSFVTGALGLSAGRRIPVHAEPRNGFRHRVYLGWITDLASAPDENAQWPSMRVDNNLLRDYEETLSLLESLRFTEIAVWGFYLSNAWPPDIESAAGKERGERAGRLIAAAHRRGIRVLSGLGVYSWGFDGIIRANPDLARGNPQAMCASEPKAWEWMRRVVDFVFRRFPIDGISMQSADLGRCRCDRCSRYSDPDYHALLNVRVADYVRSKWPGKTIGVNSWGLRFEEAAALPALQRIGAAVDYIIDVTDSSRRRDPHQRREITRSIPCDFGTLGGPQVEPPQHWRRDRWFLPTPRRVGAHIAELHQDGGRACEFFFHILRNPGDELTTWVAGKTLADPGTHWRRHAETSVEQLYGVTRSGIRDALLDLFLRAEDAYFDFAPPAASGTISLEPLVSDHPGPPVYLKPLTAEQREEYARRLSAIAEGFRELLPEAKAKENIRTVLRCLDNARRDATLCCEQARGQ